MDSISFYHLGFYRLGFYRLDWILVLFLPRTFRKFEMLEPALLLLMTRFLAIGTFGTTVVLATLSLLYLPGLRSVQESFGGRLSEGFGRNQSSNGGSSLFEDKSIRSTLCVLWTR